MSILNKTLLPTRWVRYCLPRDLSDDLVPLIEGHRKDSEPTTGNDYEPMGSAISKRFVNRLNGLSKSWPSG